MKTSNISWTDYTWNPWQGCDKVDAGCKNCYMFREMARFGKDAGMVVRSAKATFRKPLSKKIAPGSKIFTCSWSDFFHPEADAWRAEAWEIIKARPDVTFQILTKRPERIAECLPPDWGNGYANVWLGVSVTGAVKSPSSDDTFRIYLLGEKDIPCAIKFLSIEPLLGDYPGLVSYAKFKGFSWVIVGGESGSTSGKGLHQARKMELEWMENVVDACKNHSIPVFVKQLGSHYGPKHADINTFPENLQIRQFPV